MTTSKPIRSARRTVQLRRRGAAYVFFLGAAMLVIVIGMSAIAVMRIRLRADRSLDDAVKARIYAQSAIEYGLSRITLSSKWRLTFGSGTWLTDKAVGDGLMSLTSVTVADGDAKLTNNPIVFTGTGKCGDAVHKIEVKLEAVADEGGMVVTGGTWKRHVD